MFFRFSWLFDLLRSYRKIILKKKFIFLKFLIFVLINPLSLLYQTKKLKQKNMTTQEKLNQISKCLFNKNYVELMKEQRDIVFKEYLKKYATH